MISSSNAEDLTQIALEQNYRVKEYSERRGIPGILSWWSVIKREDRPGKKHLVIETAEEYETININGKEICPTK